MISLEYGANRLCLTHLRSGWCNRFATEDLPGFLRENQEYTPETHRRPTGRPPECHTIISYAPGLWMALFEHADRLRGRDYGLEAMGGGASRLMVRSCTARLVGQLVPGGWKPPSLSGKDA